MNEQLHPLSLGEILDRTAHLYRSRFLVFLGISIFPAGAVFLFVAGMFGSLAWMGVGAKNGGSATGTVIAAGVLIAVLLLFVPLALAVNALGEAAMTDASARLFLGSGITIRGAYGTAWRAKWRFLGLYVLQGLIIVGIPAAVFFISTAGLTIASAFGAAHGQQSVLIGALMFLLILGLGAVAVWLLLRFCLAFPACVVEQTTATNALQRGSTLSHGTRSRIFVLYLLGVVLNQVLAMGITIPAVLLIALVPALSGPAHERIAGMIGIVFTYGAFLAVKALVNPIYGIALTLFYFDQRIRKEGFDIEWMMQQAGMLNRPSEELPVQTANLNPDQPESALLPGPIESSAPIESSLDADSTAATDVMIDPTARPEPGMMSTPEEGRA